MAHKPTVEELKKWGFKRVSGKYRIIARVDVTEEQLREIMPRVREQRIMHDHFRRVHSADWVEGVPLTIFKQLPGAR